MANSLKKLTYAEFLAALAAGRKNNAMPPFRQNKDVMCHRDALYIYLRARAERAVARGKPEKHEPKPEAAAKAEDECFGQSWRRRPIGDE